MNCEKINRMKNITLIAWLLVLLLLPLLSSAQKEVIIHMNTDSYPSETRWVLYSDSLYGSILDEVSYGYYTQLIQLIQILYIFQIV